MFNASHTIVNDYVLPNILHENHKNDRQGMWVTNIPTTVSKNVVFKSVDYTAECRQIKCNYFHFHILLFASNHTKHHLSLNKQKKIDKTKFNLSENECNYYLMHSDETFHPLMMLQISMPRIHGAGVVCLFLRIHIVHQEV